MNEEAFDMADDIIGADEAVAKQMRRKAYMAEWRAKNRAHVKAYMDAWHEANPFSEKSMTAEEIAAKRAYNREWMKKSRQANPKKYRDELKERYDADPTVWKKASAKRRAQFFAAEGSFVPADIHELFKRQNGKCANCGVTLTKLNYEIDHIIPLSKGGTNWPTNLQLLCRKDNRRKHDKYPAVWAEENAR